MPKIPTFIGTLGTIRCIIALISSIIGAISEAHMLFESIRGFSGYLRLYEPVLSTYECNYSCFS